MKSPKAPLNRAKRTNARRNGGACFRLWLDQADQQRLALVQAGAASLGIMNPSAAVVLRAGLKLAHDKLFEATQ